MSTKEVVKRLMHYVKPYGALLVGALVCAVIYVVMSLLSPVLIGQAVDGIIGPGQVDFAGIGRIALYLVFVLAAGGLFQWLMTLCTNKVCYRTVKDLLARGAFTVSMGTAEQVVACDYVGLVSGNQVPDKFARAGFHATKSEFVDAPCIDELPIAVSCRVVSYDPESCRLVGEIVNVSVDEAYLTPEGKVDVDKVAPITYDSFNKTYVRLGAVVGRAFHDGAALK